MNKNKIWRVIFIGMALLLAFPLGMAPIAGTSATAQAKNGVLPKPDLMITDIGIDEVAGGYRVKYQFKNGGTADAPGGGYVRLTVDGRSVALDRISTTIRQGTAAYVAFGQIIQCSGTSDTISVYIDANREIDELNEGNNQRTITYTCPSAPPPPPAQKPDLVIADLWTEDTEGGYIVFCIVKNIGTAPASQFQVYLIIDGSPIAAAPVPASLNNGDAFPCKFSAIPIECSGTSDTIEVCVDPNNSVDELDENNNCMTLTYNCPAAPSPPPISKADLYFSDVGGEKLTEGYIVTFKVKNQGTAPAQVEAVLILNGQWMTPETFGELSAGEEIDTIEICVDPNNNVDELNEDNNCETIFPVEHGEIPTLVWIARPLYEVAPGDSFLLEIWVSPEGGIGISGGSIEISFPVEVMQVDAVEAGDLLGSSPIMPGAPEIDNTLGTVEIDLARTGATTPPTRKGIFASITCTVKDEAAGGTYRVFITSAELLDENFTVIPLDRFIHGDVTIAAAYPAWDINQDGMVDFRDLAILAAHYGETTSPPYPRWDINQDGTVDYRDLALLAAHYGETY
jgi:hypothetical protein